MDSESKKTIDHNEIRAWAEHRGGKPAVVVSGGETTDILRLDFPKDGPDENLEEISWERFFDIFENKRLAFLCQERTEDGHVSRFFKFIDRE